MADPRQNKEARPPDALQRAVLDAKAAAREVIKDAAALARQAAVLRADAAQMRADAQRARPDPPLTIPEAARSLHVSERTLRRVLGDPCLSARLIERTRKIGIYYKTLSLIPEDLFADLPARLPRRPGPECDAP